MRAVVITEELVEAAWKFTVKSARMGSVTGNNIVAEKTGRLSFNQRVRLTISVCFGMFFCTLLLSVPCALDDPAWAGSNGSERGRWVGAPGIDDRNIPRRVLQSWNSQKNVRGGFSGQWDLLAETKRPVAALHGMGVLFRRGSRAMNELIVAHLTENASASELRTFLRTLHRSGAMARADLVLLFPKQNSLRIDVVSAVIEDENLSYRKLVACLVPNAESSDDHPDQNGDELSDRRCASWNSSSTISFFNALAFPKAAEETRRRRRIKSGDIINAGRVPCEGSIMGFEMEELDPDNLLAAFIDNPPAQLRRWVCYQMLLGLLRHRFRNVMLARIGAVVILGDALAMVRKSNRCLFLLMESRSWDIAARDDQFYRGIRHLRNSSKRDEEMTVDNYKESVTEGTISSNVNSMQDGRAPSGKQFGRKSKRKLKSNWKTAESIKNRVNKTLMQAVYGDEIWNSLDGEQDNSRRLISSGIILGTMAPVRSLSNAMVNEVIRVTLEKKSKEAFPDQVPLSYLVHRSSVLGRRVADNLQLLDNRSSSFIYTVSGTNRTVHDLLLGTTAPTKYAVIDGLSDNGKSASVAEIIHRDLCNSTDAPSVYPDCTVR